MEPPGKLGNRDLGAVDVDQCGVAERTGLGTKKQRRKKAFDELAAGFTSGSVGHLDLRVAEPDGRGSGRWGGRSDQAIELRLTIAALRCS